MKQLQGGGGRDGGDINNYSNLGKKMERAKLMKTYNSSCVTKSLLIPIGITTAGIGSTEGGEEQRSECVYH